MDPEKDQTRQEKLGMSLQVLAPEPGAWTSHFSFLGPQGGGRRMSETLQLWDGDTVKMCRPGNRDGVRDTPLLLGGQTTTGKG